MTDSSLRASDRGHLATGSLSGVREWPNRLIVASLRATLRILAAAGSAEAQFQLGQFCDKAQDYPGAANWYRKAAEQGHVDAQYRLAQSIRLAASRGDAAAQVTLGDLYASGAYAPHVPQDQQEAVRWYRLAAEQGLPSGHSNLGVMYASGAVVPTDDREAAHWIRIAAERGYEVAQTRCETALAGLGRGTSVGYGSAARLTCQCNPGGAPGLGSCAAGSWRTGNAVEAVGVYRLTRPAYFD